MAAEGSRSLYELAFRERDGVAVALLWDGSADRLLLNVRDARAGEWFLFPVDSSRALDAFRDPFEYLRRAPRPS